MMIRTLVYIWAVLAFIGVLLIFRRPRDPESEQETQYREMVDEMQTETVDGVAVGRPVGNSVVD